jgi:hypothetical protein
MTYQTLLKYGLQWGVAVFLGAVTAVSISAEQGKGIKSPQAGKPAATLSRIIYKPPLLDAPPTRVGGSIPGTGNGAAILQVLAPDHAGLTTHAQPTLYWYASTPLVVRFEIAPINEDGTAPLLKVEAGSKKLAGIQQLDLGDHNISLQPEFTYQWSVVPVTDKGSRSAGIIASGLIERMELGEGLTSRIERSHGTELVNVYASEGIWYDALETISSMIEESPGDKGLEAIRASLLDQVGLQVVTGTR